MLDSGSMAEVKDIIRDYYQTKVRNTDDVWAKAHMAIAKKMSNYIHVAVSPSIVASSRPWFSH